MEVSMQRILPSATLSEAQMMAELRIVFPTLWMRPLWQFASRYKFSEGIWTGSDHHSVMPDGAPIFDASGHADPDNYIEPVHQGFIAWLERRGWAWDRYDDSTFFLVPNSYFDEPVGPETREWHKARDRALASYEPLQHGELPF